MSNSIEMTGGKELWEAAVLPPDGLGEPRPGLLSAPVEVSITAVYAWDPWAEFAAQDVTVDVWEQVFLCSPRGHMSRRIARLRHCDVKVGVDGSVTVSPGSVE